MAAFVDGTLAAFGFLRHVFNIVRYHVTFFRQHSHPAAQPHSFTSDAFVAAGVVQPIPAPYFPQIFQSWRVISFLQFLKTCLGCICLGPLFSYGGIIILEIDLLIRLISLLLRKANIINKRLSLLRFYRSFIDFNVSVNSRVILLFYTRVPNPSATRPQSPYGLYPEYMSICQHYHFGLCSGQLTLLLL